MVTNVNYLMRSCC